MLTRTKAIVLHLAKHSDNSYVLHLFTQEYGRVTVLVYGISGRKGALTASAFAPLNIIQLDADFTQPKAMPRINTKAVEVISSGANDNITQKTQAMFLAELLYNTLTHQMQDEPFYLWIESTIYTLRQNTSADMHLKAMLELTQFLGITPELNYPDKAIDMYSGEQFSYIPDENEQFTKAETAMLYALANDTAQLTRHQRQQLLNKLCRYYEIHIDNFQTPRSVDILALIFDAA